MTLRKYNEAIQAIHTGLRENPNHKMGKSKIKQLNKLIDERREHYKELKLQKELKIRQNVGEIFSLDHQRHFGATIIGTMLVDKEDRDLALHLAKLMRGH